MALPPNFLDELRSRTPIAAVIGRRVRLARSGRQWKGCCPFHGEKNPSFYVYDDHYHCFGCGAHGDAIGFVMQSQGTGFMEAVEQLASEAGMDVPQPTPEAAEAERRRLDLGGILEAAAGAYQRRLFLPEGHTALTYLLGRGLTLETIKQFGLGWSGEGRGAIAADLAREGVTADQLVEVGVMRRDDETGRTFDLFYNRVMFPIRDRRGRTISFGGRIMGDGQPKYVNGPETALFSKRRNLYGLDMARNGVRSGQSLVVVEGYMDVIALHQAGFTGAVAPLGTALTDDQLELLWQVSPVPILCFDGDAAGSRAAARGAEIALPLITAEKTLQLVTLPSGEDPDSLVRRNGPGDFQAMLTAARPLADVLYDVLREGVTPASGPELRAAFMARLDAAANLIADKTLAGEYRTTFRDRFYAERRQGKASQGKSTLGAARKFGKQEPARASGLVIRPVPSTESSDSERLRILTAILLRHPALLEDVEPSYARLTLDGRLERVRQAIREWADRVDVLDSEGVMDHLTTSGLQADVAYVLASVPVPLPACAFPSAMLAEAGAGWWHIFGFLNVEQLRAEVEAARGDFDREMTRENQNRLTARVEALLKVQRGEPDGIELEAA